MTEPLKPETIAATHGVASDTAFGAAAPPLHLSSTYPAKSDVASVRE